MKKSIKYGFPAIPLILSLVILCCHSKYYSAKSSIYSKPDTAKVLSPVPFRLANKTREFLINYEDSSYAYGNSFEISYWSGLIPDSSDKDNDEWTIYYKKGNIKAKGRYQYSNYQDCCYAGPCTIPYTYKTGKWTYWYENGQKMREGIYTKDTLIVENSCGERVMRFSGEMGSSWKFWDEHGRIYVPDSNDLLNVQIVDSKNIYRSKNSAGKSTVELQNTYLERSIIIEK
ncbi:MAG: hypothetical protein Q8941_08935 [Bacteroidota bacterium]|nr:hypothetical protein [Bacteroidota bacterium]